MRKRIHSASAAFLFLVSIVTLTSAFDFPNRSRNLSTQSATVKAASSAQHPTTLTFADRVAYQRAIEEVYWRHRIWPKERPDPKPSLDAVISQAQIEGKVEDYLRNSQALEDYWQRPITAEQLQAEMDRMAQHTKQPEVLRELFTALGDDPFVIAECLARPALAERLLTNWYAYDETFHGGLKQRAEAELRARSTVEQMKQLSGKYSEIELVKSDTARDADYRGAPRSVKLNSREWNEAMRKLAAIFGTAKDSTMQTEVLGSATRLAGDTPATTAMTQIKTGMVSPLREQETHYYATAVLSKTDDRLKLATVAWDKEPLESWIVKTENEVSYAVAIPTTRYTLPHIAAGGCSDDTWTDTSVGPDGRIWYMAVWTGSEMIVWGGTNGAFDVATGWRYNPSTDTWTATSMTNAPVAREFHAAVWTGSEMIVWGGRLYNGSYQYLNSGGRYNPSTDTWTATSTANAPSARIVHTAVWTGSEMIAWGGFDQNSNPLNSGGRYNPSTDSWIATTPNNAPTARAYHTAVWTGSEMIVWGGTPDGFTYLNTGGRYDPTSGHWVATNTDNAPSVRDSHTAVWTGSEMVVWGGYSGGDLDTGGKYDPTSDTWTATSTLNVPDARYEHTAVWTGNKMIVWGGAATDSYLNTGGRYDPNTDSWIATNTTSAPLGRDQHTAVWTGKEMIVWGGFNFSGGQLNTGGRYDPTTDSWTATASTPSQRDSHTAVWTGNEMIVWGGIFDFQSFLSTGGRYNPGTDSWTATSTTSAPEGRDSHTAVWTGSEMIVWGGFSASGTFLNNGGKYTPGADSWTATSTTNAPQGRYNQAAVWTGSEMIIWGGYVGSPSNTMPTNTGGRYNSDTDSWTATTTTNAPSARSTRAAVWTGSEMVVWGGYNLNIVLNTGGRYNPSIDSWIPTSTTNAPNARTSAAAVWTGTEMIVWGGYGGSDLNTGGRYNPSMNNWTTTTTVNAPDARYDHTAAWTGSEMIVWGGTNDGGNTEFNTGGRYCAQSQAPMAQSAFSRKTHGAAGAFDIRLPLTGNVGIECRSGGSTNDYQMIINFMTTVTVGSASVTSGTGSVSSFTVNGSQVTVNLTGVINVQRITMTLFNVNDGTHMGNVPVSLGVLVGDVNGNATVNASDVSLTKSQVGHVVTGSNFREDVNANGVISSTDVALVKSDVGTALPP